MSNTRSRTRMRALYLLINAVEPPMDLPSILKQLDVYKELTSLKLKIPKTKKTKYVRKILALLIYQTQRLLGIKRNPNKSSRVRYTRLLTPEGKEMLRKRLKQQVECELPKVIATERWKDNEGREV